MTVSAALALLKATYPRADFPEDTVRVYARLLSDLPQDAVGAAVTRLCKRSVFLPSVAEIRRSVAEDATGLPSPEVAWDIVTRGSLRTAPEPVRQALEAAGGRWSIVTSEHPEVTRAQFVKDYVARRERAILVAMGAATAGELLELNTAAPQQALPPAWDDEPTPNLAEPAREFMRQAGWVAQQTADGDAINTRDEGSQPQ